MQYFDPYQSNEEQCLFLPQLGSNNTETDEWKTPDCSDLGLNESLAPPPSPEWRSNVHLEDFVDFIGSDPVGNSTNIDQLHSTLKRLVASPNNGYDMVYQGLSLIFSNGIEDDDGPELLEAIIDYMIHCGNVDDWENKFQGLFDFLVCDHNAWVPLKSVKLVETTMKYLISKYNFNNARNIECLYSKCHPDVRNDSGLVSRMLEYSNLIADDFVRKEVANCFFSKGQYDNSNSFKRCILDFILAGKYAEAETVLSSSIKALSFTALSEIVVECIKFRASGIIYAIISHGSAVAERSKVLSLILAQCLKTRDNNFLVSIVTRITEENHLLDVNTVNSVTKHLGHIGELTLCKRIFDSAFEKGAILSEISYGCILDALVENADLASAMEVFEKIKTRMTPNTIMYSTLIKGYAISCNLPRAIELHKEMKKNKVPINTVTYNTLVDACARVGSMDVAASLLREMLKSNIEPDLITFSTVAKGYCVQGNVDRALELLNAMRSRNIRPDGILFNSLLDGCVRAGRLDLCESLWTLMQESNIAPSNFTLTILIKMCGKQRALDRAFRLTKELPLKYSFTTNAHVFTCLMSACLANKEYQKAFDVFHEMKRNGVHPDARSYETMINGLLRCNKLEDCASVLRCAFELDNNRSRRGGHQAAGLKINLKVLRSVWQASRNSRQHHIIENTFRDIDEKHNKFTRRFANNNNDSYYGNTSPYYADSVSTAAPSSQITPLTTFNIQV